ncbi:cyclic AMP-dependent transcription factor ATF-6 beta isoform X2 [Otolemur garnettii]|uniref:cyclic AMP-dependent transcription factor ATF-6 beta isoform X2 n=1 Tax=Otolemur garnettii TaxID=30611 RepID=UPI00064442E6|nr:cyclic AMP-dependent transcription factor ATF-6 beta isoform X2 [Otolemur garnettii]
MVGGWGEKMAELMLLSEIADPTRFFTDNLLSPEDWDSTLYTGLDEVAEEQTQLFRCQEEDVPFDSSSLDVGMDATPPEPPWDLLPIFPDLQVKSEPSSPCSSSSISSESSLHSTEPSNQALGIGEVLHVKTESVAPPLCLLGDDPDPTSSFETIQVNVDHMSDDSSDVQTKIEPVSPSSSINSEASVLSADSSNQAFIGEEVLEVKTESPSPPGCLLLDVPAPSLGAVQISMGPCPDGSSGKALPTRKPPLQPKPVVLTTVPMPPRAVPPSTTVLLQPLVQPPPVVLIQGAIRVQTEGPSPPVPRPERKSIVPAPMPGNSCPPEVDAKLLKRQQRMIKNRESACQSRKKKKEYLQGLEARLQAVLADNQQLRRENAALRRRLEALLAENSKLKLESGNRKVVCIMVFLLFITFNFGPVSITEPPPAPVSPRMGEGEPRPQRHLLEFSEQELLPGVEPLRGSSHSPEEPQLSPTDQPSFRNLTAFPGGAKELLLRDLDQLFLSSDCRHFNRTESLRLADELSGWVQRHQRGRRKIPQRTQDRQKSQLWKKSPPVKAISTQPPGPPERDSVGQLQLYRHPERSQPEFLDAIDRREDTFYVVSFRRDHLLLPAISHNKTSRPKMSLVMPAMAPNETLSGRGAPGDYEEMMQIECEVMDTRVIHIKTSTVPPSLRKQPSPTPGNATGGPLPASAASQTHQASHQPLYLNHP